VEGRRVGIGTQRKGGKEEKENIRTNTKKNVLKEE
jgi:hypothetical protein